LPDVNEIVMTREGEGKVVSLNILEKTIRVQLLETDYIVEFSLDEIIEEDAISLSIPE